MTLVINLINLQLLYDILRILDQFYIMMKEIV